MNYRSLTSYVLTGWLTLCGTSFSTKTWAAETESIQPLFDSQTYAVLVVNPDHFNLKASMDKLREWISKAGPELAPSGDVSNELASAQAVLEKWVQDFHQAGGRQVYVLANAVEGLQFVVAVPLTQGGNRQAIEKLLEPVLKTPPFEGVDHQMKGDCLLLGQANALSHILSGKSVERTDLVQALNSIDGCGVGLALSLASDQRRVLHEMLPHFILGQTRVPTDPLIKGVNWASLGINMPPDIHLKVSFQTFGEAELKALNAMLQSVFQGLPNLVEDPTAKRIIEGLYSKLKIQTDQNRLTFILDTSHLENLLLEQLLPVMAQAKGNAQRIRTINNAKQILLGCRMYETDNKKWPDNLKILTAKGSYLDNANVLKSPDHPDQEIGYEYLIPGKNSAKYPTGEHVVLFEKYSTWPKLGLCVGFMDGSVQWIKEQSRFDSMLAATKARNAEQ
jgi:hypothetical protein